MHPFPMQASRPKVSLSWGNRDGFNLNAFEMKHYTGWEYSFSKIRLFLGIKEARKAVVPG